MASAPASIRYFPRKEERAPVSKDKLGTKQVCPSCESRFYDLNKRPAVCPKCGADFDP